jgi:hypothetical protein
MQLSTLASIALTAALPAFVETVLCLPILLSTRARALFRSLPPTESVVLSYLSTMFSLSIPFVVAVVAAFGFDGWQRPIYDVLTQVASLVSLSYIVVLPIAATVGLPRYGMDWDPTGYGIRTWVVMLLSTLWYVIWFMLPIMLISALLALPTG